MFQREEQQDLLQLLALGRVEWCEERVVELACERAHLREHLLAVRSHRDDLPAAIIGVAAAFDEALLFHLVEQPDELPAVVVERVCDRSLRLALALGEGGEDGVVVGVNTRTCVRLGRLLLRFHPKPLQQEHRRRDQLFWDAVFHFGDKCSADYRCCARFLLCSTIMVFKR